MEVKLADGRFLCEPCHNITFFFDSEPVKPIKKIEKQVEPKIEIKSIL